MQIMSALMLFTKQCVELDANQSCMSVGAQCTEHRVPAGRTEWNFGPLHFQLP